MGRAHGGEAVPIGYGETLARPRGTAVTEILFPDDIWVHVPFEVDKKFDGLRVDQFLTQRLKGYSRSKIQDILDEKRVSRDGRPLRASSKVRTMDHISVTYPRRPEEPLSESAAIPVLWEDDALIVIDKPAGLLSHPTDKVVAHTVLGYLAHHRPELGKLHLLHRLDRDTSGVLALAKTSLAARRWTSAMEARHVEKEYLAFVHGTPSPKQGTITCPIGDEGGPIRARQWVHVEGAVPAATQYEVIAAGEFSVVRAQPKTGRLHQIRVHLASIGHPLLGDPLYTGKGEAFAKMVREGLDEFDREALGFARVALHAATLRFDHPMTRKPLLIQAPLADDMRLFLLNRNIRVAPSVSKSTI